VFLPPQPGERQNLVRSEKNRGQAFVPDPGRAFEFQKANLLGAAELAIVVDDVAVALLIIIQFAIVPTAVAGLAACMQIVAAGTDLLA